MTAANIIWTIALLPLTGLTGTMFAIATSRDWWLLAACLGVVLVAVGVRMVGLVFAARLASERNDALADAWDGKDIESRDFGFFYYMAMLFSSVFLLVSTRAVLEQPRHGLAWLGLVASALALVAVVVWFLDRPGCHLRITRRGIWDPNHDWLEWTDVTRVAMREERNPASSHPGNQHYYLQLAVRQGARHRPQTMARRSRRGVAKPIWDGSEMEYDLNSLPVHPQHALTAARACWALAVRGEAPVMSEAGMRQATIERRLAIARTVMGCATGTALAAWALAAGAFALHNNLLGFRWP